MTSEEFWHHISLINTSALDEGDENRAILPLQRSLEALDDRQLEAFEEHLSVFLYALDGREFADNAGESGDSDDGFLYARCYVVAKGRKHYELTLNNPKLMPKTIDQWCEALLYPHRQTWAKRTGRDESEWSFDASVSYESGSNEDLW